MKINIANKAKIDATLSAINGRAVAHTATASEIVAECHSAEIQMEVDGLPKNLRAGATLGFYSGSRLPNAYKGRVIRNWVTCTRTSGGWFLTSVARDEMYSDVHPFSKTVLTEPALAYLVAKVTKKYS